MAGHPERSCMGCGAKRPQRELVRLGVRAGQAVVDGARRMGGRGGYLCGPGCLDRAVKRKGFGRAFKRQVEVEVSKLRTSLEEQLAVRGVTLTSAEGKH